MMFLSPLPGLTVEENYDIFTENNIFFGLKDKSGNLLIPAEYKKLIRLGNDNFIAQKKNGKFGIINSSGEVLIKLKYSHAERLFGDFAKLGNDYDYGIYDKDGHIVVPPEFSDIQPLFGKRFLTVKNFKYGIYSSEGKKLADNVYDFIYMPTPKTLRIKKGQDWFEIEKISNEEAMKLSKDEVKTFEGETFKITRIFINTGVGAGYTVLTAADYTLKTLSSFSAAYEATIDELMFSQGADTVSVLMKFSWLPKFPGVFAKKYFNNFINPDKGPLSGIRNEVKDKLK